ncbi:MAG TPA: ATP-grasp domain-containing protein [Methylomirabilota bacterium]|nr:ATP-grasp domain-containing protein [Methylomirabilota bacterium]
MSRAAFEALVLDAHLRQALVTVRSLGRRGLRAAALESFGEVPAFASRWCARPFVCPAPVATGAYLAYLEALLASADVGVVIPSHDGTLALLREHRARLEGRARLAIASEAALAIAVNKPRTLAVAERLGIAVPRTVVVARPAEVSETLRLIGLPAVVKPSESWMATEAARDRLGPRLVTTPGEAAQAAAAITDLGGSALFQPLLTGRREAVSLLYAGGEIRARFAQWAKRTGPPLGGESVLRQSIAVPADIGAASERLVREIDLEGYSEVEFRRDAGGRPYLMEINPRLSASVEIAVRAGVDFPTLLYRWAAGERVPTVTGYRSGGWMRHLRGDLMTTLAMVRGRGRPDLVTPGRAVLDFCVSFCRPMAYDYLDWRDPLPAVVATAGFARAAVRAVVARGRAAIPRSPA